MTVVSRALALAVLVLAGHASAAADGPLKWYSDDYPAALADARASDRPLVIDLWAIWCHTCLSMKHTVLRDPAMAAVADRFVWLEMDTERARNAPALEKFPPEVWPTFFVVDPRDESVAARLLGAADRAAFVAFLDAGARRMRGDAGPFAEAVRSGDMAAAAGRHTEAARRYAEALAAAADDPRVPAVLVARMNALYRADAEGECLAAARAGLARALRGHTPAAADFVYYLHACARGVEPPDPSLLPAAEAALEAVLADEGAPLTVDDRSEALRIAREIHLSLGRSKAARARAEAQRALLEEAAAGADPRTALTWHWPRAEVHAFLGRPAALIPAFEASEAALPEEYEPPYRLAWIQWKAGRLDEAQGSAKRAIARVYGPRAARAWALLADIERARGDRPATRAALAEVVEVWRGLPPGQQRPAAQRAAEAALAAFDAEGGP